MSNLKKWGIGCLVAAVGFAVVGVFALLGKLPPAVVYTCYGVAVAGLGAFGIVVAVAQLPQPPSE